jgi:hypothetical protein
MGQDAGIAVAYISPEALAAARAHNPALSLRKYRVAPTAD